jgi:hypothetical protein
MNSVAPAGSAAARKRSRSGGLYASPRSQSVSKPDRRQATRPGGENAACPGGGAARRSTATGSGRCGMTGTAFYTRPQ